MASGLVEKIKALAGEIALRESCQLYDLEFVDGGSRTLRVYIDKDPDGASLDDCVNVSRALNLALDVEDLIPGGRYDLEVSTPGLERKLTEKWHFEKAIGRYVQVKFEAEEDKNKTVKGDLKQVSENALLVEEGSKSFEIPMDKILKAKTLFKDTKGQKGAAKKSPAKKKKR